jgi:4'-phosphopantetheinyl transferase EntD
MFSGFDGKNALFKAAFPADHQVRRMAEAMCDAYYAAQVWASASPGTRERWMGAATDALARVKADAKKAA